MTVASALVEIMGRPTIVEVLGGACKVHNTSMDSCDCWVLVGWSWRPKWVSVVGRELLDSSTQKDSASSSSSSSQPPAPSTSRISIPSLSSLLPNCIPWTADDTHQDQAALALPPNNNTDCSSSQIEKEESCKVSDEDLRHICQLVEEKDSGPAWIHMMNKSTPTMGYQAWRRDPQTGPPQYRSRTVFEDASPETVRDFFWDDEFRAKWDDILQLSHPCRQGRWSLTELKVIPDKQPDLKLHTVEDQFTCFQYGSSSSSMVVVLWWFSGVF